MRLSLRTGCRTHLNHEYIDQLIETIGGAGNCFDEVWLATSYGIPSLSRCKKEAEDMAWAAERFRKAGIAVSMQLSRTVGHSEEALITHGGEGVSPDFDLITSIDGVSEQGIFCWNSPAFRTYICEQMKIYVAFEPEIVWVDDDIRLRLLGKSQALCFCDNCIRLFNECYGYQYDRVSLKNDFINDLTVRKKYIQFQTDTLADFAGMISKAIHEVSPDTVMALQNGGNTMLAIHAQKACLDRMYEVTGKAPAFRAGGGFYNDHQPKDLFVKAMTLNYMNARLPEYVKVRSCEIENLPFTAYGKSPECTCIEAAVYMAYGCNEASVTLMRDYEPLKWHMRMFKRISQYRPFLEAYEKHNAGTVNGGIVVYQPIRSNYIVPNKDGYPFWNDTCIWEIADKLRWGLPFSTSIKGNAYYLSAKTFDFLNEEDMEFLADKTVIAEPGFLEKIQASKYAESFANIKCVACEKFYDAFNGVDISYEHREALRSAIDRIADKPLPAYVASPEQMMIVPRVNEKEETVSVFLLNVSMTDTEKYEVVIVNPVSTKQVTLINPYSETVYLPLEKRGDSYVVKLPELRSWRVAAILI